MKRTLIVVALAVALTFMFAAAAFADHSPTFYVEWSPNSSFTGYVAPFGNAGTGGPHANYLEGTEKCGVCHSVHRAPVAGVKWDTNNDGLTSTFTNVAGGQYRRQEWAAPTSTKANYTTQMLLKTDVADSCAYCHITTAIGGDQLYGGKISYVTGEWNEGFAHGNACSACHAVHGVASSYGNTTLWGQYGTFRGPIQSKVLKLRAKGSGGAVGTQQSYAWQDETVAIGSLGKAEFAASGIAGAAAWAAAQTAQDYTGANNVEFAVDPLNVPLFPSPTDAIDGTNVRPGTNAYDAQSGIFCTFCHVNYGYASEATVNPDGDRSLFQGPWAALNGVVPNTRGDVYAVQAEAPGSAAGDGWSVMRDIEGYGVPFKNHPVKSVYGAFAAAGKSATVPNTVAFAGSETCVSCHDAGLNRANNTGMLIQSYPHFTPGYFHFVKSAAHVGAGMTNDPVAAGLPEFLAASDAVGIAAAQAWLEDPLNYEEAVTVQDGQCLKCHVDVNDTAGVGKTY